MSKVKNIVSFSGGKDSTAMLLMMLERGIKVDRIICIDTTKEFPAMYRHIERAQKLCPITIEIIKIDFDYWFSEHIKTKGKHKGKKGYGWPDFRNRWCTALKREAVKKVQKELNTNVIQYHGISYDEKDRVNNNKGSIIKYPLVDWKVTGKDALNYCYKRGLDWEGLYEKFHRVSCWCCPLSRVGELRTLYNDFPDLWSELTTMDEGSFRKFRNDYTVKELTVKFQKENNYE